MIETDAPAVDPERRLGGRVFWVSAVIGWAVIGYGLRGLLQHRVDTRPPNLATFVVGGALVHDLVFAPVVLFAGVVLARAVPGRARRWLQAGLLITGCLALFAYPLVRDYAKAIHNPSSLPHNYTANLGLTVGVVWGALLLGVIGAAVVHRRASSRRVG